MKNKLIKLTLGVALGNAIMLASALESPATMANAEEGDVSLSSSFDAAEASSEETISSEEASSSGESASNEGQSSKEEDEAWEAIEEYVKELERQIKQFNDTKFLNGTIGGLISSALTLLVYVVFKIADKKGWKSRTELFSRANSLLGDVQTKVDELHTSEALTEGQYETATKAINDASDLLNKTNEKLDATDEEMAKLKEELTAKYEETMKSVQDDYAVLMERYEKLLNMLLEMAKSSPDMIKSGTYEKMVEINSKMDDTTEG